MFNRKHIFLSGSILLIAAVLFTFNPIHVSKVSAAAQKSAAAVVNCPSNQSEGANNDWVEVVQYKLNSLENNDVFNFSQYPLATDGSFGANTHGAVITFQQQSGLPTTGVVDTATWSMMGLCNIDSAHVPSGYTYGGSYCPPSQSDGNNNTFVDALQHMINVAAGYGWISTSSPQSGWYALSTDGDFGANTLKGVKDFQSSNGLSADGNVGPVTWGAMGMCW